MHPTTQYAHDVLRGDIVAGPLVRAQCRRHLRDLEQSDHVWSEAEADRGLAWFKMLQLGAGSFDLLPWQAFLTGSICGWRRPDGTRRFRRLYVETGKGSGKTPWAAGLALLLTMGEREYRAEGYVCARTMEQALVTYRDMVALVQDTPALATRTRIMGVAAPYNILFEPTRSFVRRLAAQDEGRSGYRVHVAVIDEYHEHRNASMVDMMFAGFKFRKQPLLIITTNAGVSKSSACGIEHDYAASVAAGDVEDGGYLPYVCALDDGDLPDTGAPPQEVWIKTNPSLPLIPGDEYISDQVKLATGMPSKRAVVDRLTFCKWTDALDPWIDEQVFDSCLVDEIERSGPCYVAIDLSSRTDFTAAGLVWAPVDSEGSPTGVLHAEVVIWTPEDTLLARADTDRAPYREWADAGHLTLVPGAVMDYRPVAQWLQSLQASGAVIEGIAYDPWRFADLVRELEELGVNTGKRGTDEGAMADFELWPHPQGFRPGGGGSLGMPTSIDYAEQRMLQRTIRVKNNPALRSAMLGAVTAQDESLNRRFLKKKSHTRIDPAVALTMAIGLACSVEDDSIDLRAFFGDGDAG